MSRHFHYDAALYREKVDRIAADVVFRDNELPTFVPRGAIRRYDSVGVMNAGMSHNVITAARGTNRS